MVQTRSASSQLTPRAPRDTPARTPRARSTSRAPSTWSHIPPPSTLVWMAVSLPLVIWDTGYVLLRPHSMPGGKFHWPLWVPYKLYGEVDHMYGFKQFNAGNGFTSAQGMLNSIETAMYLAYMYLWWTKATPLKGRMAGKWGIAGRSGGLAVVLGFSAAVMTLSKTLLYWLNEYFSAFDNIGHNKAFDLVLLWIIPNGLWLVFPTLMIYSMSEEIIGAFAIASSRSSKSD